MHPGPWPGCALTAAGVGADAAERRASSHRWCASPCHTPGLAYEIPVKTLESLPKWHCYGAGMDARAAAGAGAGAAAANRRASSDTGRAASCPKAAAAPEPAPGLSAAHVGGMQVCTPDTASK